VRILSRISRQNSSSGLDGGPAVRGHPVVFPHTTLRAAEVIVADPTS
jgi:hypothetical protein